MWDGAFSPFIKHRDYQHNSVAEHLLQDKPMPKPVRTVSVRVDPIKEIELEVVEDYYQVDLVLNGGKKYAFLVPLVAMDNKEALIAAINEYFENPIDGGRDIANYIEEST